jgi:hypothetical protein
MDGVYLRRVRPPGSLRSGIPSGQSLTSISIAGGEAPRWSADGRELFFVAADGKMNVATVKSAGSRFDAGTPVPLIQRQPGALTERAPRRLRRLRRWKTIPDHDAGPGFHFGHAKSHLELDRRIETLTATPKKSA